MRLKAVLTNRLYHLPLQSTETKEAISIINENPNSKKLYFDHVKHAQRFNIPSFLEIEKLLYNYICCKLKCNKANRSYRQY